MAALIVVSALGAAGGCQRGAPPVDPAYRDDIDALCNSIERAHAEGLAPHEQQVTIAMWLGPQIKTADGRAFLVELQSLRSEPKAQRLEAEGTRVGLPSCPLAVVWRADAAASAGSAHTGS